MTDTKNAYISPLSTRYASKEMQYIFSENFKFTTFHGAGHGISKLIADTDGLMEWMFSQNL